MSNVMPQTANISKCETSFMTPSQLIWNLMERVEQTSQAYFVLSQPFLSPPSEQTPGRVCAKMFHVFQSQMCDTVTVDWR